MNICDTTAKILLIVFNCIFWAFGIAILAIGIWIKTDPELSNLGQAVKVGTDEAIVEIITWLFIGAGIFVFAVGVVGFIGTIRESKIMMGFYIVCVFIVFAAEASAGVYAGVRKDYLISKIKKEGAQFLKTSYGTDEYKYTTDGFNYIQQQHKCCGVGGFMDYENSTYIARLGNKIKGNATLSWACCHSVTILDDAIKSNGQLTISATDRETCMGESITVTGIQTDPKLDDEAKTLKTNEQCATNDIFRCGGCVDRISEDVEANLTMLVGIGVAIGLSQLILLFLALWFCQSLGAEKV